MSRAHTHLAAAFVIVLAAAMPAAGRAHATDAVKTRAALHDNFARIAFDWSAPVAFQAKLDGATLAIHFDRPFTTSLDAITHGLDRYAARASLDASGTTLTVILKRKITLKTSTSGNTVAIDLVDAGPDKAGANKSGPDKAGPDKAGPDKAGPDKASASPPNATAKPPAPAPASKASDRFSASVRFGEHDGYRRLVFDWKQPVDYSVKEDGNGVRVHFSRPVTIDTAKIGAVLPDTFPQLADEQGGTTLTLHLRDGAKFRHFRSGTSIALDLLRAGAGDKITPTAGLTPPPELISPSAGQAEPIPLPSAPGGPPPASASPANGAGSGTALSVRYTSNGDTASLRFPWAKPVAAAIFRRAGALWVVFSAPAKTDAGEVMLRGKAAVDHIEQIPNPDATILRIATLSGLEPTMRRADNDWILDLKAQEPRPELTIAVDAQPSARPSRVVFEMHDVTAPVTLRDPEVGDELIVVPTREVGRGIGDEASLVDFRALSTMQGLVIRPNQDGVITRLFADGVEVTGPEGLVLSADSDRAPGSANGMKRLFDFPVWRGPPGETFLDRRSELEQAVADAPPSARSQPRLALAQFYFANLYGAETLGVIEAMERDDPNFAADPVVRTMKGAAFLLSGDRDSAAQELDQPVLDGQPEVTLWRGSLALGRGDAQTAANDFVPCVSLITSYPTPLRNRFALEIAEALIRTDQADAASPFLRMVDTENPNPEQRALAQFLVGLQAKQRGDLDRALETWQEVARSGDRESRARALEARTMALLDAGKITRATAIQQLDALRFAWRGGRFEFNLLHELGTLLIAEGDYGRGIETLRDAVNNFADYPEIAQLKAQMTAAFTEVFLGKDSDSLSPLKSLALYNDFKDLMPAGEPGAAILHKLSDRLVAVDLLDQADAILDERVKNSTNDLDKARVVTQLAAVRLLDQHPDTAIAALDVPVTGDLPADLVRQRLQLRARALIGQDHADQALALLGSDTSHDADLLRAEIYWKAQNWPEAAQVFGRLVDAPGSDGKLPEDQAQMVVNWAAALTLAGDQAGLGALRDKYGAAMAASQQAEAFRVIASDAGVGPKKDDLRARANDLAQIGELQNFMAKLKQGLATDQQGAIN